MTKAGGNKFNGSAYYYLQNEKFNANDFFFNKEGIDKPKARRNEGGFTIGGPVVREKWFFFGGYQFTNAITGFVPTARSITVLPSRSAPHQRRAHGTRLLADAFNAENGCAGLELPDGCRHLARRAQPLQPAQPCDGRLCYPHAATGRPSHRR